MAISGALALSAPSPVMAQLFPETLPLDLVDLTEQFGFAIDGEAINDRSGTAVELAGDINGDGIDDIIISASGADPNGESSGRIYVLFGKRAEFANPFLLSSVNAVNGFQLNGESALDGAGRSVSTAGDINNDGIDDIIIGARGASPSGADSGRSYVVFGSDEGLPNPFPLSSLNALNGFVINGESADDSAGLSVSGGGDLNGDGIDDVVIGSIRSIDGNIDSSRTYVIFG